MAMYATISHKWGDSHEYVTIYKSKKAALTGARFDVERMKCKDSEAYMIKGLDDIGYIRSDFEPENLRKYGKFIIKYVRGEKSEQ